VGGALLGLFSQEQQIAFFRGIRDAGLNGAVQQYEDLVKFEETTEHFVDGGKYLPLSVWRTQG
jgi:hypothetical protein